MENLLLKLQQFHWDFFFNEAMVLSSLRHRPSGSILTYSLCSQRALNCKPVMAPSNPIPRKNEK
jgi:hypothetical protein